MRSFSTAVRLVALTFAAALLGCSGCGASAIAQGTGTQGGGGTVVVPRPSSGGGQTQWIGGAPGQHQVAMGTSAEIPVGVWLEVPEDIGGRGSRPPMAIALAIDTSGSMQGDKIANARAAAVSFLETLRDGDEVSIFTFASDVRPIALQRTLTRGSRLELISAVAGLEARGSTAMYGGVQSGTYIVGRSSSEYPIRRVIVISDGRANVGPSDPGSFGQLAANGTEWGAQVSAIGVGLDYDERTLAALAMHSAGRMYHLQEPAQLAGILDQELQLLAATVATHACIEITPAPGVEILGVDSLGVENVNGRLRADLGTVFAGQRRELLIRTRVAAGTVGDRPLASVRMTYTDPGNGNASAEQALALNYTVTADQEAARRSAEPRVAEMVAQQRASEAQLAAADMLTRGDAEGAGRVLRQAEAQLQAVAASAPMASPSRARLEARSRQVRTQSTRAAAAAGAGQPAQRAAGLEAYDSAMSAEGY